MLACAHHATPNSHLKVTEKVVHEIHFLMSPAQLAVNILLTDQYKLGTKSMIALNSTYCHMVQDLA